MLANVFNLFGMAWWVEVNTATPHCTYYFGPFASASEAEAAQPGYVEDLEQEGAQGIEAAVKRCKPTDLTIVYDEAEPVSVRSFSGQVQ